MILYLDSSAIVKKYVIEPGSEEVEKARSRASAVGTAVINRVEVVAALAKAARMKVIGPADAEAAIHSFNRSWPDLIRTRITERLIQHASDLATVHGLRGYDSVQLASAAAWQQAVGNHVTFATFDRQLWRAAKAVGLEVFPQ
jgi:uncharacterized protein